MAPQQAPAATTPDLRRWLAALELGHHAPRLAAKAGCITLADAARLSPKAALAACGDMGALLDVERLLKAASVLRWLGELGLAQYAAPLAEDGHDSLQLAGQLDDKDAAACGLKPADAEVLVAAVAVLRWLDGLGMARYACSFAAEGYDDLDSVELLEREDLTGCGVVAEDLFDVDVAVRQLGAERQAVREPVDQ